MDIAIRNSGLSIIELERILQTRQRELKVLLRRRTRIERKLTALDERITRLGGTRAGGRVKRARNDVTLPEAIANVLGKSRKPLTVGDIMGGVQAMGYRSSSGNFRAVINQTLIKDKRFISAGRGLYEMKH
jgi:hypothetical protein